MNTQTKTNQKKDVVIMQTISIVTIVLMSVLTIVF